VPRLGFSRETLERKSEDFVFREFSFGLRLNFPLINDSDQAWVEMKDETGEREEAGSGSMSQGKLL